MPMSPSDQRVCRLPVTSSASELAACVRSAPNSTAAISLPATGHPQFISQWLPTAAGLSAGAWIWNCPPASGVAENCGLTAHGPAPIG